MKRKLFTALILSLFTVSAAHIAKASETMDLPQDTTNIKVEIIDNQNNELNQEETTLSDNENSSKTMENTNKTKEKRKFFKRKNKKQKEHKKQQTAEDAKEVIVDSEIIEYFPERFEFEATGDAKVSFPEENALMTADKIVYNHDINVVKAYGNIIFTKDGQKVYGDFIQVDLNENNALITRPILENVAIKIRAKNAIVTEDKTEALDGFVTINQKANYKFISRPVFGFHEPMMDEVIPKNFYFKEKYDNKWRLKAKTIVIDSRKDRDVATLKNADIYIKDTKLASAGNVKLYTDKEQKYMESNLLELGSLRNLGAYISPGVVIPTPNASTLKIGPALTYKSDIGVGALGRFMTDKNRTAFGWGSSNSKFVIRGEQEMTENLTFQYGLNSYLSNWFLGSRMPKYGFQFLHHKNYDIEDLGITFQNRFVGGFARDWGERNFSTTKFAWQTSTNKELFRYKNEEAKFAAAAGVNVQTHAALYGTGDTMGIVRTGPYVRTQYRSWQQYLGYYLGGQAGDSPFYFDKNFYGKSNIVLGESLRISKYLTLMYTTTIVVSGDTPDGRTQQENRIYFMIGPDDVKFMIGYDMYRKNASMGFMLNVGAENSDIAFNRLILQDPQAIGKSKKAEKQKITEEQRKAEEQKRMLKEKQSNPMERSVTEYEDYDTNEIRIPGSNMIQPTMFRPVGM